MILENYITLKKPQQTKISCVKKFNITKTMNLVKRVSTRRSKDKLEISKPYDLKVVEIQYSLDIKECPFDFKGYGPFVMKNSFFWKKKKVKAFLFEKIIIFTAVSKQDPECYYYKGSVKMEDVILEPLDEFKPKTLQIKDFTSSAKFGRNIVYKLKAETEEAQTAWRNSIVSHLWQQFAEIKSTR